MFDDYDVWATASLLLKGWPARAREGVEALIQENLHSGNFARALMWQEVAAAMGVLAAKSN